MAWRRAAVRHVEAAIETHEGVRVDDDDLDDKVEAVIADLGLVPGRVGYGPHEVCDGDTEDRAGRQ